MHIHASSHIGETSLQNQEIRFLQHQCGHYAITPLRHYTSTAITPLRQYIHYGHYAITPVRPLRQYASTAITPLRQYDHYAIHHTALQVLKTCMLKWAFHQTYINTPSRNCILNTGQI